MMVRANTGALVGDKKSDVNKVKLTSGGKKQFPHNLQHRVCALVRGYV